MSFSARAEGADIRVRDVSISEDELSVALMDGRTIIVPLAWYSRLEAATAAQRRIGKWRVRGMASTGPNWTRILSTEGLLAGARAPAGSAGWRSGR